MRATAPILPPTLPTAPPPTRADRAHVRPPRTSHRRALAAGLLVSGVFHLLLLVLAWRTRIVIVPTPGRNAPVVASRGERRPIRVERIAAVPDAVAGRAESAGPARAEAAGPARDKERAGPARWQPEPGERRPGQAEGGAPAAGGDRWTNLSPADWLRPRIGDPRLWERPAPPPLAEPSDIERARARIAQRLGEWNDSVAAGAAEAARATDWTVTDKNGGRWGVSPGKIHLGDLTLPLPFGFSAPPHQREAAAERARRDKEIADQGARSQADENLEERAKAIRERKDREREEKKKSGSGSGGDPVRGSDPGHPDGA